MKLLEKRGGGVACNLGTGRGLSVLEIIKSVERATGQNVPYTIARRRPGDCPMLISDMTLASELLGFEPRYPDVDEIVSTAGVWHQNDGQR